MPNKTFHILTLGCPKNRVDAEVMWAALAEAGYQAVENPAEAELIVVNTCAFIRSAVTESLDVVLELSRFKKEGRCSRLVVAGCMTARYGDDLVRQLPEVDLFIDPAGAPDLVRRLTGKAKAASRKPRAAGKRAAGRGATPFLPRANSLSPGAAYLKVAEGCSRRCSFCIIPQVRGPQVSRPIAELAAEAEALVRTGAKEIVLVAQDLASYGSDLKGRPDLADLVETLAAVPGLWWLRMMYLFPVSMPERLLKVMALQDTVLPYLDIPFQHADAGVLARMRRGGDPAGFLALIEKLRGQFPRVVLRSSLMTGFPGETAEAFSHLRTLVERGRFERLGVFEFSPEEGTDAATLSDPVPAKLARSRRRELLELQQQIALDYHRSLVGQVLEVLVEEEREPGIFVGRTWNQAPEVDGQTVLRGTAPIGEIVRARVVEAGPYDLEAEIV